MEQNQIDLLERLSLENLILLKEEAEKLLEQQIKSEEIILGKVNNMFQVQLLILTTLTGYYVANISEIGNLHLFICTLILGLFDIGAMVLLICILYPKKTYTIGVSPSSMLFNDIYRTIPTDNIHFIRNRIRCMDDDIGRNRNIQANRVKFYNLSTLTLITGLVITFLFSTFGQFLVQFLS